jgi:hypothetical protein
MVEATAKEIKYRTTENEHSMSLTDTKPFS